MVSPMLKNSALSLAAVMTSGPRETTPAGPVSSQTQDADVSCKIHEVHQQETLPRQALIQGFSKLKHPKINEKQIKKNQKFKNLKKPSKFIFP